MKAPNDIRKPVRKCLEAAASLQEVWFVVKLFFCVSGRLIISLSNPNCSNLFGLGEYCREKQSEQEQKGINTWSLVPSIGDSTPESTLLLREQRLNEENVINERVLYKSKIFEYDCHPKRLIHAYCGRNKLPLPTYEHERYDREYSTIVSHQGKKYASVMWHREKDLGEQAAAVVLCLHLRIYEREFLQSLGCMMHTHSER